MTPSPPEPTWGQPPRIRTVSSQDTSCLQPEGQLDTGSKVSSPQGLKGPTEPGEPQLQAPIQPHRVGQDGKASGLGTRGLSHPEGASVWCRGPGLRARVPGLSPSSYTHPLPASVTPPAPQGQRCRLSGPCGERAGKHVPGTSEPIVTPATSTSLPRPPATRGHLG